MKSLLTIFAALAIGLVAWKLCFPGPNPATATSALFTQWDDQLYSLDANEDVRFVPPPFSSQRPARIVVSPTVGSRSLSPQLMIRIINGQIGFTATYSGGGTVQSAFMLCAYLSRTPELELPNDLGKLSAHGDWIVRDEASRERRMQAMASILSSITGRKLAVERRSVEREVIIARGKWEFDPSRDPNGAQFYVSKGDVRGGGLAGSLADSFTGLERELGQKIIDETEEPRPREVYWTGRGLSSSGFDGARHSQFLASLEKQTSLKFVQTRRVIPVWIVSEKAEKR
jgi:hypothetical protein